jgi:hypothetical protein
MELIEDIAESEVFGIISKCAIHTHAKNDRM